MKETGQKSARDRPATYRIEVQGRLDQSWSDWFNGLTITLENDCDDAPTTTLTGPVTDQSALRAASCPRFGI